MTKPLYGPPINPANYIPLKGDRKSRRYINPSTGQIIGQRQYLNAVRGVSKEAYAKSGAGAHKPAPHRKKSKPSDLTEHESARRLKPVQLLKAQSPRYEEYIGTKAELPHLLEQIAVSARQAVITANRLNAYNMSCVAVLKDGSREGYISLSGLTSPKDFIHYFDEGLADFMERIASESYPTDGRIFLLYMFTASDFDKLQYRQTPAGRAFEEKKATAYRKKNAARERARVARKNELKRLEERGLTLSAKLYNAKKEGRPIKALKKQLDANTRNLTNHRAKMGPKK